MDGFSYRTISPEEIVARISSRSNNSQLFVRERGGNEIMEIIDGGQQDDSLVFVFRVPPSKETHRWQGLLSVADFEEAVQGVAQT